MGSYSATLLSRSSAPR